jgi:hypothetical protein
VSAETLVLAGLIVLVLHVLSHPKRRRAARRRGHTWFYEAYLGSRLWKFRRWLWFWTSNHRCAKCHHRVRLHSPDPHRRANFHHLNYRHIGRERRGRDIQMLCAPCHMRTDAWRHR